IALRLAERAGIETARHQLLTVAGKPVLLSCRFDRIGKKRIPFLLAMSVSGVRDGERGSYPELVDLLAGFGARAKADATQLYCRVAFNVLVSNVDDHLRNHGFLWAGPGGWILSPAYDLNPTPVDEKARILATNIDLDKGTCSIDLLQSAAIYFGLSPAQARAIVQEVARVTQSWQAVAREAGAKATGIDRMASAFEHDDLQAALKL
ncbi:MAG: HipA domain-containing protein, partial [Azoarcus sp.]|nr:HipA domain-containing protein [Azoarcus sp.]